MAHIEKITAVMRNTTSKPHTTYVPRPAPPGAQQGFVLAAVITCGGVSDMVH